MRPVIKSDRWDISTKTPLEINPYGDAKPDLVEELGSFCSFCGKPNTRSALHIEHILPKKLSQYTHLEFRWDNFLLGCVNCNSVKGTKDVLALEAYMPHLNNLLCFINLKTGGYIEIKTGLTEEERENTQAYIDLVGLDRIPGHRRYSEKDDRWEKRMEVYDVAQRQLAKYTAQPPTTDIENIVTLAQSQGFFAVWFNVFRNQDSVREALIVGFTNNMGKKITPFPATDIRYFDASNHYEPIPKP